MKRILIGGINSYIGNSFAEYLTRRWPGEYEIDSVDMKDADWQKNSFQGFDCVFYVAGIVHRRETTENAHLYYEVNRDLTVEAAKKARAEGVKQFIFLSTMSVYGLEEGCIGKSTPEAPVTHYGRSKLEGERGLEALRTEDFHVAILRPPMVYGEGCRGRYQALVKLAKALPIFPDYPNKRSMIHIDRLCEYAKAIVDEPWDGVMLPQDEEYVCTSRMVAKIARSMGKRMVLWRGLNPLVALAKRHTVAGRKAFGDLYYAREE